MVLDSCPETLEAANNRRIAGSSGVRFLVRFFCSSLVLVVEMIAMYGLHGESNNSGSKDGDATASFVK